LLDQSVAKYHSTTPANKPPKPHRVLAIQAFILGRRKDAADRGSDCANDGEEADALKLIQQCSRCGCIARTSQTAPGPPAFPTRHGQRGHPPDRWLRVQETAL